MLEPLCGTAVLNVRELAGLWHLMQADDDVSMIERTTARRRLPLPASVASGPSEQGCRIGTSDHQGNRVPVHLPDALLRRRRGGERVEAAAPPQQVHKTLFPEQAGVRARLGHPIRVHHERLARLQLDRLVHELRIPHEPD